MDEASDDGFTPPPSKRRARSVSHDNDKNDPSYRGNRGSSPIIASTKSDYFPATRLFEYQWPLGDTTAEYFMLQEQVKEFLDIRGIQRKYPDWRRRTLDLDERKYLVGMDVVTETLSNMGLVALHSEEVLETMAADYPSKYTEYVEVLREREFQQTLRNKMVEARRMAAVTELREAEGVSRSAVRSEALSMVGQFNRQLAQQREMLTKGYIDPHTKLPQVPRSPQPIQPVPLKSRYPAALLPGQYSDYCPVYTTQELSLLPLNTVTGVPEYVKKRQEEQAQSTSGGQEAPKLDTGGQTPVTPNLKTATDNLLKALKTPSNEKPNEGGSLKQIPLLTSIQKLLSHYSSKADSSSTKSEDSSKPSSSVSSTRRSSLTDLLKADTPSGKGSSDVQVTAELVAVTKDKSENEVKSAGSAVKGGDKEVKKDECAPVINEIADKPPTINVKPKKPKVRSALCNVCRKGRGSNTKGVAEELLRCTQCDIFVHPTCYKLPSTIHPILKLYDWQCLECKTCEICSSGSSEDKMVFCDECDRGYHSFCVGMEAVPAGSWLCPVCGRCGSCASEKAGPRPEDKWKHEYVGGKFIHTHCVECSGFFRKGYYCPICYKIYRDDETDSPMVCCDECDKWIHTGCGSISGQEYERLSKEKSKYICKLCTPK